MALVCVEVVKRYALNMPTAWIFDASNMLYGSLFMLAGAYTLAQNAHVRGDFLYSSMRPRTQATLDLVLYIVFFLPGIAALLYAGYHYAALSWRIGEHSTVTADGPADLSLSRPSSRSPAPWSCCRASPRSCAASSASGPAHWPSRLKDVDRDRRRRGATRPQRACRRGRARTAIARAHLTSRKRRASAAAGDELRS